MRHISIRFALFIFLLRTSVPLAGQELMPVNELKPGMRGTAKTIFQGDDIEEFGVEIIDILQNFYPKRDLIVVRLHGEKAEFAGPTAGMSGSPVYVEGKLVGALAYSFANFPKDPLMGVTPIQEMLEIFDREKYRKNELAAAGGAAESQRFLDVAMGFAAPDWEPFLGSATGNSSIPAVKQLPITLNMSGFCDRVFQQAVRPLASWNLQAARGGSAAGVDGVALRPGAPIAAVLVSGDYDIAATGTVTYANNGKVLAFGHPFFDNGPVELPMAQAHILVTISSSLSSTKMSSTGKIVGTLRQDRTTGIMGEIGPVPEMTQVHVTYNSENGEASTFQFQIARERTLSSFVPLLLRLGLINSIESARLGTGFNSLRVSGVAEMDDGTKIALDNLYAGYQPLAAFSFLNGVLHSTGDIASRIAALTNNPYRPVNFKNVDIEFTSLSGRRSAVLENIWLDKSAYAPGDTIEITCRLRPYFQKPYLEKQKIKIPEAPRGKYLQVVVGGAMSLNAYERRLAPGKFRPISYEKLLNLVRHARRNDRLFIQLRLADRGMISENVELPGLPPSIYPVMANLNGRKQATATRDWVLREVAIPQSNMVQGIQVARIRLQ